MVEIFNVALCTDSESLKLLNKKLDPVKPDKTVEVSKDLIVAYWSNTNYRVFDKIHLYALGLPYYDFIVQANNKYFNEMHSEYAPYVLSTPICYFKDNKWEVLNVELN